MSWRIRKQRFLFNFYQSKILLLIFLLAWILLIFPRSKSCKPQVLFFFYLNERLNDIFNKDLKLKSGRDVAIESFLNGTAMLLINYSVSDHHVRILQILLFKYSMAIMMNPSPTYPTNSLNGKPIPIKGWPCIIQLCEFFIVVSIIFLMHLLIILCSVNPWKIKFLNRIRLNRYCKYLCGVINLFQSIAYFHQLNDGQNEKILVKVRSGIILQLHAAIDRSVHSVYPYPIWI